MTRALLSGTRPAKPNHLIKNSRFRAVFHCENMNTISFKRGDTLSLAGTYKVNGVATSVAAMTIRSQVRKLSDALVQDLTVAKTAGVGTFTLSATAAQTASWDVTTLKCDIEFSLSGVVQSTETFNISVLEDVTT